LNLHHRHGDNVIMSSVSFSFFCATFPFVTTLEMHRE
jgi:hypothetical protein